MADSLDGYLGRDRQREALPGCFHGPTDPDREVPRTLARSDDPPTVGGVADRIDRPVEAEP